MAGLTVSHIPQDPSWMLSCRIHPRNMPGLSAQSAGPSKGLIQPCGQVNSLTRIAEYATKGIPFWCLLSQATR